MFSFYAPIWLAGLLPWAALVAWLLWGRRRRVDVPFIDLWKGPVPARRAKRAMRLPPIGLAATLAAMLLAVFAAARPGFRNTAVGRTVTIIVDRGITMSARGKTSECYRELIHTAGPAILSKFGSGPVNLVIVPSGETIKTDRDSWAKLAAAQSPTAVENAASLRAEVRRRLSEGSEAIVVLSDQVLEVADERLVRIGPETTLSNVGIVRLAAREGQASQLMVRVRNQSALTRATLTVLVDGAEAAKRQVELPPAGEHRDYFADMPKLGKVIRAELAAPDDLPADNVAWLVREQVWPIIEARTPLRAELQRMVELYTRQRPGGAESKRVAIVGAGEEVPTNEPAIVVANATTPTTGEVRVADHAVTKDVQDWPGAMKAATLAAEPNGAGWTSVVSVGGKTAVAVRTAGARQVWVGFENPRFSQSADFVIFWTNVLTWAGEGGDAFASGLTGQLGPGWTRVENTGEASEPGLWPGLYRRNDGALRAINSPEVRIELMDAHDWRKELTKTASSRPQVSGTRELAAGMLLATLGLMAVAAATWVRRNGSQN
jgi:hypothetical protein